MRQKFPECGDNSKKFLSSKVPVLEKKLLLLSPDLFKRQEHCFGRCQFVLSMSNELVKPNKYLFWRKTTYN